MVKEDVAQGATEKTSGVRISEMVLRLVIPVGLDRRVTDRAVLRAVALHPAVLNRAVDAGVDRSPSLKQARVEVAAPRSGPGALVVVRPASDARGQRRRRRDELPPLGRTPVGDRGEIDPTLFATGIVPGDRV